MALTGGDNMDIWHRLGRICMLFLMWSMRQNEYLAVV